MPTTRVMLGIVNMEGHAVNTLKVGRMVSRHPRPRYETTCQLCNTRSTESQDRLTSGAARCLAAHCGKPVKQRGRDLLSDERQRLARREAERIAEELEASERRMVAEVESVGWEKREAQRQADEEQQAIEAQEAAEAAQREREESRRKYWSEAVLDAPDPRLYVTPELVNASMPKAEAEKFNAREVAKFIEMTPDFAEYRTPQNADKILAYLSDKNGVRIFDAATMKAAFVRLRDLGILEKRPAPTPVRPAEQPRRVDLNIAPPTPDAPAGPTTYVGRDYVTGGERTFTQREVDRMSSLEYQRAFQVVPTVSELFTRMSEDR